MLPGWVHHGSQIKYGAMSVPDKPARLASLDGSVRLQNYGHVLAPSRCKAPVSDVTRLSWWARYWTIHNSEVGTMGGISDVSGLDSQVMANRVSQQMPAKDVADPALPSQHCSILRHWLLSARYPVCLGLGRSTVPQKTYLMLSCKLSPHPYNRNVTNT